MDVIAERKFRLKSDASVVITARVYRPLMDGDDFRCDYSIDWPGKSENGKAFGVDSVQALLLAIQRVGVDVYCSDYVKNSDMIWLEEGRGFGLVLPSNLADLYRGDDPPI